VSRKLKVLDLFSGIGGFALGLDSTGFFETVKFVEMDKYCQKVLRKNFPNIPIEEDIKNVEGKEYEADVVVGGFPCQPFSVAGKQKGTNDNRYLWPEMLRLIKEIKPEFVIGENVQGIINLQNGMVLRQVQDELESEGFEVQCFLIPASGIGAWHQRYRVWIVAHSQHNGLLAAESRCNEEKNRVEKKHRKENSSTGKSIGASPIRKTDNGYEDVSNTEIIGTGESRDTDQEKRNESCSPTQSNSSSENVSNTDTRLSIGENEEVQARRETIDSGSPRGGEIKLSRENVENPNSRGGRREERSGQDDITRSSREKQNHNPDETSKGRGTRNFKITDDVSNTNSSLRGGRRTISLSGEDKVWRFRVEEKGIRDNVRIETVGRNAVSGEDVSNTEHEGLQGGQRNDKGEGRQILSPEQHDGDEVRSKTGRIDGVQREERYVTNTNNERTQISTEGGHTGIEMSGSSGQKTWWQIESDLCGVPNGISYELDKDRANRIKTLGNAIVPQIAREIGLAIKKVINEDSNI